MDTEVMDVMNMLFWLKFSIRNNVYLDRIVDSARNSQSCRRN